MTDHQITLGDVLVDTSHDITDAMLGNWSPVPDDQSDAYRHGVADGVRFLLSALMVGNEDPEQVPMTDQLERQLEGVMYLFGERNNVKAVLAAEPV